MLDKDWYTTSEVGDLLGFSDRWVRRQIELGRLKAIAYDAGSRRTLRVHRRTSRRSSPATCETPRIYLRYPSGSQPEPAERSERSERPASALFRNRRLARFDGHMTTASPSTSEPPVEVRSSIESATGRLDVVARSRADRWWVTVTSVEATADGIGTQIGAALLAAFDLSGVDAEELDR